MLLNRIKMDMIINQYRAGRRERDDSSPIQRAEEECSPRDDGIVCPPSQPNQGHTRKGDAIYILKRFTNLP